MQNFKFIFTETIKKCVSKNSSVITKNECEIWNTSNEFKQWYQRNKALILHENMQIWQRNVEWKYKLYANVKQ